MSNEADDKGILIPMLHFPTCNTVASPEDSSSPRSELCEIVEKVESLNDECEENYLKLLKHYKKQQTKVLFFRVLLGVSCWLLITLILNAVIGFSMYGIPNRFVDEKETSESWILSGSLSSGVLSAIGAFITMFGIIAGICESMDGVLALEGLSDVLNFYAGFVKEYECAESTLRCTKNAWASEKIRISTLSETKIRLTDQVHLFYQKKDHYAHKTTELLAKL